MSPRVAVPTVEETLAFQAERLRHLESLEIKLPVVDIRAFGARIDGNTNDCAAVQAAIDAAEGTDDGAIVRVPATTAGCIIGNPGLTLKPKVSLMGDGYGSKLIGIGNYSLIKNDPTLAKPWQHQFIANLKLSYEGYDPAWENARCIKMTGTAAERHPYRNLIYNVMCLDAYAGFRDTSVGWGWTLMNFQTEHCRYGIWKEGGTTMTFIGCITAGKGLSTYDVRGWYIADCAAPVLIGCGLDGYRDSGAYTDPDAAFEAPALFADCSALTIRGFDLEVSRSKEDTDGSVVRFHNCPGLTVDGLTSYQNQIHLGDGLAWSALLRFSGTTRGSARGLTVGGHCGDAAYGGNANVATILLSNTAKVDFSACNITKPTVAEGAPALVKAISLDGWFNDLLVSLDNVGVDASDIYNPGANPVVGPMQGCHGTSWPIANQTINAGATYTSGDLRGANGVPGNARGVFLFLYGRGNAAETFLYIDSADDTPDGYSPRIVGQAATLPIGGVVPVRLGTGANAGKVKIKAGIGNWTEVYAWPVGYWT